MSNNNGRMAGLVAIVTGGASGMGKASALKFAREGAKIVIADMNEENGKGTVEEFKADGLQDVRFVAVDVAEEADVERMVGVAMKEFGRVDCVFNNAGIGGVAGSTADISVEDWDYTFAVLMRGVFLGTKHGVRAMREHGEGGTIINTASVAGLSGGCGPAAYSAAKAAVVNFTRAVAVEFAPEKIRVNAICPGGILTPLLDRTGDTEGVAKRMAKMQPWPETGLGEHIAGAALFLASEDSRFVTGEALVVDGGLEAGGPMLFQKSMMMKIPAGTSFVDKGSTGQAPVMRGTKGQK